MVRGGCMRGIQPRGLGEWNEKNALTPAPASVLSPDAAQRVAGSRPAKNGDVRFRMAAQEILERIQKAQAPT